MTAHGRFEALVRERARLGRRRTGPALPQRSRGAALLTAMIIVALIATLASAMLWQQWRAVQVEAAERERGQSAWILAGALDWARLILREDSRAGGPDHLGEPWAVPLQEARLSSFLASDRGEAEDAPDAFLSGEITDAQARYNLANLVNAGRIDAVELAALRRLCETAGVSAEVATRLATGMRDATPFVPDPSASAPAPDERPADPPLLPSSVRELGWLGIDGESLRALEPYVVVLPERTFVNVNTASREVLASTIEGMDLATAERVVQARQRAPLRAQADLRALAPQLADEAIDRIAVGTGYFEVRGRLRLGQVVLEQRSLVKRQNLVITVLQRERIPGRDTGTR